MQMRGPRAERTDLVAEERELAAICARRGLEPRSQRLWRSSWLRTMPLVAHARDELRLSEALAARPLRAALSSVTTFTLGPALPILVFMLSSQARGVTVLFGASLICPAGPRTHLLCGPAAHPHRSARRVSRSGAAWPWRPLQAWEHCSGRPRRELAKLRLLQRALDGDESLHLCRARFAYDCPP